MDNKLREVRSGLGLNQRQVAELSHTPQGLLSAVERGVLKPWPAVAERLSVALGVSIDQLFPADAEDLRRCAARQPVAAQR